MKNNVVIKDDYAEIIIDNKKFGEHIVLIDLDDVEKINSIKWYLSYSRTTKSCYVHGYNKNNKKIIPIHRFITNCPKGLVVDHINRKPLDNRKQNLRICTQAENLMNRDLEAIYGRKIIKNRNNGKVIVEINDNLKKQFLTKLAENNEKQKKVITKMIEEYIKEDK